MYKLFLIISFLLAKGLTGSSMPSFCFFERSSCASADTFLFHLNQTNDEQTTDIENKKSEHFKYAIQLNIPVELVDNLALYQVLAEWHGTRYVFGGSTKRGTDCSGFTQQVMKEVYNIHLERVVGPQYNQCRPIEREELKQGDLLFFHTTRAGLSHVGLYLGNNKFIHASTKRGVIVDDLNSNYYRKAYRKAGRIIPE